MFKTYLNLIWWSLLLEKGISLPFHDLKPKPYPVAQNSLIEAKRPIPNGITTGGYSHENITKLDNRQWMSLLPDATPLSQISMPGTHESLAIYGGDLPQCQSLPIQIQLRAGIRVLDVRCRHKENLFRIHHENYDQRADFNNVLTLVIKFLDQNPSEVLLIRIREEFKPEDNNQTFEETFNEYIKQDLFSPFIWEPTSQNPALGEVRGKIVFLQDFSARKIYGLDYQSFDIQDDSDIKNIYRLYDKWEKIKKQLIKADKQNGNDFVVNYLSGSGAFLNRVPLFVMPYFVASGRSDHRTNSPFLLTGRTTLIYRDLFPDFPRAYCLGSFCLIAFEGTNELTLKYIQNERPNSVGILMIDFPGDSLIEAIIKCNRLITQLDDKQIDYSSDISSQQTQNYDFAKESELFREYGTSPVLNVTIGPLNQQDTIQDTIEAKESQLLNDSPEENLNQKIESISEFKRNNKMGVEINVAKPKFNVVFGPNRQPVEVITSTDSSNGLGVSGDEINLSSHDF